MANDNWEYALDMDKLYGYGEIKWYDLDEPGMPSPEDDEDDIDD